MTMSDGVRRVLRGFTTAVFFVVVIGWLFVATFLAEPSVWRPNVLLGLGILLPSVVLTGLGALLVRRVRGREVLAVLFTVAGAVYFLWAWGYVVGGPAATLF